VFKVFPLIVRTTTKPLNTGLIIDIPSAAMAVLLASAGTMSQSKRLYSRYAPSDRGLE
jgi:hypothetical protein